jgi:hypothetical protein
MEKFADLVAAKSAGKIEVSLFPGGVLGADAAKLSALQGGTLEMLSMPSVRIRRRWPFPTFTPRWRARRLTDMKIRLLSSTPTQ